MKVGILAIGQVAPEILVGIQDGLVKTFPDTTAVIVQGCFACSDSCI